MEVVLKVQCLTNIETVIRYSTGDMYLLPTLVPSTGSSLHFKAMHLSENQLSIHLIEKGDLLQ